MGIQAAPYAEYKDSGLDWIGKIPSHWRQKRFKFLFHASNEKNGDNIVGEMLSVSGYRGIEIKEYEDENHKRTEDELTEYRVVRPGQLVVNTMWLNYAGLGVSEHEGHVSPAYRSYWMDSSLQSRFAHHLLRSSNYVAGYTKYMQGIRPNSLQIKTDDFLSFPVIVPPEIEQARIATFLDHETAKIDLLIAKQERLIELLKEKQQAVISHAVTKGLNPDAPMKDSGVEWLGKVPAHWIVTRAKFVSRVFIPQRNKPDLNLEEGFYWVTMEDLKSNYVDEAQYRVDKAAQQAAGSRVLRQGAVIASCVGTFGVAAVNNVDVIINQQLQAYIPNKLLADYLKELISVSTCYFEQVGTAATLTYVNQEGFENLPVVVPPKNEQETILIRLSKGKGKFDRLVRLALREIELLKEHRTALISAAVTGKIDVRSWKKPASESVESATAATA